MSWIDFQKHAEETGITIATAESCTGGLIAAEITRNPGSSKVFERGFVTYSYPSKVEMLGVSPETLDAEGAVSEAVAAEMAQGALDRSRATIAVSVTGVAGPGGSENKPEGRVCFGLAMQDHPTVTETVDFGALGRSAVREATMAHALKMLRAATGMDQLPEP
ncbi:CinA family protein [Falsirhodobacter deserti]|uniref:CinA family protein n=1 Tax=Falsirhodobacter deserti TaxID=1365611 RepID=UPI000FE2C52E|nr:nicotinamide-nucleotide amidohydrolase family protein [Falsirhodobacter deserti]